MSEIGDGNKNVFSTETIPEIDSWPETTPRIEELNWEERRKLRQALNLRRSHLIVCGQVSEAGEIERVRRKLSNNRQ